MFMGEFTHNIDSKGRLIMPSKFRENLGYKFVVTRGMDGCLFVYPQLEWQQLEEKLQELPLSKKMHEHSSVSFTLQTTECDIDKQGRINIPPTLRAHAQLEKACVVIGVANRIEIWSEERWQQYALEAKKIMMNLPKQ